MKMDRKTIKSKRPTFTRHEAGQKKRVGSSWKRPKGIQNKMRLNKKGHKSQIDQGYRMPRKLRDIHTASGLKIVMVGDEKALEGIDKKTQGAVISARLGMRRKKALLEQAKKDGITVLNIKDIDAYIKAFEDKRKAVKKAKKAPVKEIKKSDKDSGAEKTEADEKTQRKEQEKVLHHKQ